jgi:serpin B
MAQSRSADDTDRSRRRRHASLFGGGGLVIVAVVVAIVVSTMSGGGPSVRTQNRPQPNDISRNNVDGAVQLISRVSPDQSNSGAASADEISVARAEEAFGIRLLQHLSASSVDSNQLISPLSLSEALAMCLAGARGATANEMAASLGVSGLTPQDQADGWAALDNDLLESATSDKDVLNDANSIWTQTGFPVKQAFLDALKTGFDAGVWQADFARNPAAADAAINGWVARITNGHITNLMNASDTPPDISAVLLNAVLFEAQWTTQLTDSSPGTFDAPDGSVPVTYLSPAGADNGFDATTQGGVQAVELPYWNGDSSSRGAGRYAALLIMPTSGSLSQFIAQLDASKLDRIVNGLEAEPLDLEIPKLTMRSDDQLSDVLKQMGMSEAFSQDADFSGISTTPTSISQVVQQATLNVTKWGTVASAATAVVMEATAIASSPTQMTFDKPFIFLVRDTKTGTILFESAVNNPAA